MDSFILVYSFLLSTLVFYSHSTHSDLVLCLFIYFTLVELVQCFVIDSLGRAAVLFSAHFVGLHLHFDLKLEEEEEEEMKEEGSDSGTH